MAFVEYYREQIDKILRMLILRGKALELNMSGLRAKLKEPMPPVDILKRYKQLGGELITIGSDAHHIEHVGYGIKEGMEILCDAGFGYFAFYRGRKPVMLKTV